MAASTEEVEVLSSVHLCTSSFEQIGTLTRTDKTEEGLETYLSRFFFYLPSNFPTRRSYGQNGGFFHYLEQNYSDIEIAEQSHINPQANEDEDGDLILPQRSDLSLLSLTSDKGPSDSANSKSTEQNACSCADTHSFLRGSDEVNKGETERKIFAVDEKGNSQEPEVITLEHCRETVLSQVGCQVWSGAFLLSDYLLHHHKSFQSTPVVLDLGAGTGLTSIIAAMIAPKVICTEYSPHIVQLAERNWLRNQHLLPGADLHNVIFKVLDWTHDHEKLMREKVTSTKAEDKYHLSHLDWKMVQQATLILAAEVIYDADCTDAFFKTIYHLLKQPPVKQVLISLEKRVVFSGLTHEVCSPAYEQFEMYLEDLATVDEGPVLFSVEKLNTDFPQYFSYTRTKQLELWKISSYFPEECVGDFVRP